jgi:uncharacterized protein (DUF736 family)
MITGYIGTATPLRQDINIRATPTTSGRIVGALNFRAVLPVLVVGNEWLRVEFAGNEYYVARHIVRFDTD